MTTIVLISDTHLTEPVIPACDTLVHCGDLTGTGIPNEVERGLAWLSEQKAGRIILVPGNHDFMFQEREVEARRLADAANVEVLIDQETYAHGLRIYGSPWQPWFFNWAFNAPQDAIEGADFLQDKWNLIPVDVDLLVTHGPPKGHLDLTPDNRSVGCSRLAATVAQLKPRVHAFGHIHHSYGVQPTGNTLYVNASVCNESYQMTNPPVLIHL